MTKVQFLLIKVALNANISVSVEECHPYPRQVCDTIYKKHCEKVPEKECHLVVKENCVQKCENVYWCKICPDPKDPYSYQNK